MTNPENVVTLWVPHAHPGACLRRRLVLGLLVLGGMTSGSRPAAADCSPAPAGLVGWWPGDGNANDITGVHNGTLQGGATATAAGLVGLAFSFDGTNGYVQVPDAADLRPTNLTIEAWVRFESLDSAVLGGAPAGEQFLVFKQNNSATAFEGYRLGKTRVSGGDALDFVVSSSTGQSVSLQSATLVTTGAWYHVASVRGPDFVQLYVNGQLERQAGVSFAQDYGDLPLYFGTSGASWDGRFCGTLDEVTLYNRPLSSSEIAAIFAASAAGKCKAASITTQPQSQAVLAGADPSFAVTAAGVAPLGYEWHFNGTNLPSANSATLMLTNAQPPNAGDYFVVVSNWLGAATSTVAKLVVGFVPDPQLRLALGCVSGTNCPCSSGSDLVALGSLSAGNYEITNLAGLELAENLTNLSLAGNAISDLSPLTNLTHLATLDVQNNSIADLSMLAALTNLHSLTLGGNPIEDYSALSLLTNLASLSVANSSGQGAAMGDLSSLQNLTRLTSLTLWANNVRDVSPLAGLTNLSCLDLRSNPITNHTILSGLTNLERLYLGGTSVSNLSFVAPLTRLAFLNLADNRICDLSPLSGLTNLSYLVLSRNPTQANYPILTGMVWLQNLELRGNGLTNLSFLKGLVHLAYADLAYNQITDPSPLSGSTNLSLVLDGNTNLDYVKLSALTNVSRLWLDGNCITNAAFLRSMVQLTALGLDNNRVADPSPLAALTNLVLLGLSRNPLTNYDWLASGSFSHLAGLRLEGNSISNNAGPLTNLSNLAFLSLASNSVADLRVLGGLTNLSSLYLTHNRLCDVGSLAPLQRLRFADVSLNLVDANSARNVANALRCPWATAGEANIQYLPTGLLTLAVDPTKALEWNIPANRPRSLQFYVFDNVVPPEEWSLTATSSDETVVPNANIWLSGSDGARTVTLQSAPVQSPGNVMLTLNVQDAPDCGLKASAQINVFVGLPDPAFSLPDPGLSNQVWQALGQPGDAITSVDMLSLTGLFAPWANITNLFGLQWASNLASLCLSNNQVQDLAPLQSLWNLRSVSVCGNLITDLSPLAGLTNLTDLDIGQNPIASYATLAELTNLTSLRLTDDSITNLAPVAALSRLAQLDLTGNQLSDLSLLAGLTNLTQLSLAQNRLGSIDLLTNLPALSFVDLRLNLLNVTNNPAIQILAQRGIQVMVSPQRSPPWIDVRTNWVVAAGAPSSVPVTVWDSGPTNQEFGVGIKFAGMGLRPDLARDTSQGVNNLWILTVAPAAEMPRRITLTATNDVGLTSCATIEIQATALLTTVGLCPWLSGSNLSWCAGGDAPWFGQGIVTQDGLTAAQSGTVGNNQQSWLATTVMGPGRLRFSWRVSSEADCDWLEFSVADQVDRISGQVDWQLKAVKVPPGPQTLRWRYYKDGDNSVGLDAAWLADVVFIPGPWIELAGPPTNNQCQLALYGVPGTRYAVLASSGLTQPAWSSLVPLVNPTSFPVPFTDTNATSRTRFYRLVNASFSLGAPQKSASGEVQLVLLNPPGLQVELQVSSNLAVWSPLTVANQVPTTTNTIIFTDPTATNCRVRFYRALMVP